jgi:transcription-repair coupling factor (superfamily II helicase)
LAETKSKAGFLQIKKEIRDRFGRLPGAATNLFLISESQNSFKFLEPKKIEIENSAVSFIFRSLPKNCGARLFIEKVEGLSKKSPFSVKAKMGRGRSLSVGFSGATIKNVVELCLLFDSLFSSAQAK